MKKVSISGGPALMIAPVDGAGPRGAAWGTDGTIVFATNAGTTGLQRVSEAGGRPEVLTRPSSQQGEGDHIWPELLPGGLGILFTIIGRSFDPGTAQIAVFDLNARTYRVIVPSGSHARYVPTGHEIYVVRYPELTGREKISVDGGHHPSWSRDGRELFFIDPSGRQMFSVDIQPGSRLAAGRPRMLFEAGAIAPGAGQRVFDSAPDGRFIVIRGGAGGRSPRMTLVANWFEELKRKVPPH